MERRGHARSRFGYNNYLNSFHPLPRQWNSLAPGKTRVTMMAPTLVFERDQLALAVGAVGGNKIVTGVAQSLVNYLDWG